MLQCKRCGGTNVMVNMNTYTKTKSRSFLWNLFMVLITGGLWIIWMLVRKKKEKVVHEKIACCQSCGFSWRA